MRLSTNTKEILTKDIKGQNINRIEHISAEFIDCGF